MLVAADEMTVSGEAFYGWAFGTKGGDALLVSVSPEGWLSLLGQPREVILVPLR